MQWWLSRTLSHLLNLIPQTEWNHSGCVVTWGHQYWIHGLSAAYSMWTAHIRNPLTPGREISYFSRKWFPNWNPPRGSSQSGVWRDSSFSTSSIM